MRRSSVILRVGTVTGALWGQLSGTALGQGSQYALRFYGTGVGPPGQQDRVRIQIDDNVPGPDASVPCDVGAGSFTIDFWLRGNLADNDSAEGGGDVECACFDWIYGNIIIDRDIWGASESDWGVSIAGGFVRFGTGRGDPPTSDGDNTIEGDVNVLDGQWRHVALVRDTSTGIKRIYVDGLLDFASSPDASRDDISYPNGGDPSPVTSWGPYIVLAAEKHDAGSAYPSFNGFMDEVRIWNVARTQAEIQASSHQVIAGDSAGLVAYYRFEEGSGTTLGDSSAAGSPAGELVAGTAGNGEWVSYASNASNTAPVQISGDCEPPCDDGVFCNGLETCLASQCVAGSDPCPLQSCNEVNDQCIETVPASGAAGLVALAGAILAAGAWLLRRGA